MASSAASDAGKDARAYVNEDEFEDEPFLDAGPTDGGVLKSDFEGEVTMSQISSGVVRAHTIAFGIKRPKLRVDVRGDRNRRGHPRIGGNSFNLILLLDPPAQKAWVLLPLERKASLVDIEKLKAQGRERAAFAGDSGADAGAPPPKVVKTKERAVVAGETCEVWTLTRGTTKTELCLTENASAEEVAKFGGGAPEIAVATALSTESYFPLRIIYFDAKGKETSRLVATRIERKRLNPRRFEVPPTYDMIDLAALMGGTGVSEALHPGSTLEHPDGG